MGSLASTAGLTKFLQIPDSAVTTGEQLWIIYRAPQPMRRQVTDLLVVCRAACARRRSYHIARPGSAARLFQTPNERLTHFANFGPPQRTRRITKTRAKP